MGSYNRTKTNTFKSGRLRKFARTITRRFPSQHIIASRIYIRSPKRKDWRTWVDLRRNSYDFLKEWEPFWSLADCTKSAYMRQLRMQKVKAINDQAYAFLCFDLEQDVLLGGINISNVQRGISQTANIGYWLGEEFTNQGYMNEAMIAILPFLFEQMKFNRVQAYTLPENKRSRNLLHKLNFREEGLIRKCMKINDIWRDHILYSKLAEEHLK